MKRPRDSQTLALEQAERELMARDRRPGGAYDVATARDPEYRTMADQPLPDRLYAQAKRIAAAQGQDAATAMLQAASQRAMFARIDAEKARLKALYGPTWPQRLARLSWRALAATLAATALHAALSLGFTAQAVASADMAIAVGALVWALAL